MVMAVSCLVNACGAGWHREDVPPERDLPPRQQVQIWAGPRSRVLHAVRLEPDAFTGVPFHLPPGCDSCRVAVPRASVDSIRLGSLERGALRSLGLGYVVLGVAAALLYYSVDTD